MLILDGNLGIEAFYKVIFDETPVLIDDKIFERVDVSFQFLKEISKNKVIYGVNTGFGPMAQYRINHSERIQLQYNLIRSHASGTGNPIPPMYVQAAMLARLNTLSLGNSGVNRTVIELMSTLINKNITPLIFEHGGVGASGDLVQLAHLALVLIGEGEVVCRGERQFTKDVFKAEKLTPISVELREGLALMNGTSVMAGIGIVNTIYTRKLLDWMIFCSAAINEIVEAYDDHLSFVLNESKKHIGQRKIAALMRAHLHDSSLTRNREHHLYNNNSEEPVFKDKVQEYYSLRCVPQILGPVLDTLNNVE